MSVRLLCQVVRSPFTNVSLIERKMEASFYPLIQPFNTEGLYNVELQALLCSMGSLVLRPW